MKGTIKQCRKLPTVKLSEKPKNEELVQVVGHTSFLVTPASPCEKPYIMPDIAMTGIPVDIIKDDSESYQVTISPKPHKAFSRGGIRYPKNCLLGAEYKIDRKYIVNWPKFKTKAL